MNVKEKERSNQNVDWWGTGTRLCSHGAKGDELMAPGTWREWTPAHLFSVFYKNHFHGQEDRELFIYVDLGS